MADQPRGSRQSRAKRLAALLCAVSLLGFVAPIGTAAAADFTAADVTVVSNNGNLQSLTVAPTGTVTYRGFERPPASTTVAVQVRVDGTWETIATESPTVGDREGSFGFDFAAVDVLDSTSDGMTADEFRAESPQLPTTTTVHVRMEVTFANVGGGGSTVTVTAGDSFDVTVEQSGGPPGGGGASGGSGPPGQQ